MAIWGKGDDRWIVSDREDGTNVNSWHWNEKKIETIFKKELEEELKKPISLNETNQLVIEQLNNFNGTISIVNRKNKKKLNYNFGFELTANLINPEETKKLTIKLPEIFDYEPDVVIKPYTHMNNKIDHIITNIIKLFLENYNLNKLSVSDTINKDITNKDITNKKINKEITIVKIKYKFNLPLMTLYHTLTNIEQINLFTKDKGNQFNLNNNSEFSFYNNTILGTIVDFEVNKFIKMKWKLAKWTNFSNLDLQLEQDGSNTILKITQNNIPIIDKQDIINIWREKWCQPICIYMNCNFKEL